MTNTESSAMTGQGARYDEREALARVLWEASVVDNPEYLEHVESYEQLIEDEPGYAETMRFLADRTLAWMREKHSGPEITDEMVDAALIGYRDERMARLRVNTDRHRHSLRAALEAALRVPVGEGEQ